MYYFVKYFNSNLVMVFLLLQWFEIIKMYVIIYLFLNIKVLEVFSFLIFIIFYMFFKFNPCI